MLEEPHRYQGIVITNAKQKYNSDSSVSERKSKDMLTKQSSWEKLWLRTNSEEPASHRAHRDAALSWCMPLPICQY